MKKEIMELEQKLNNQPTYKVLNDLLKSIVAIRGRKEVTL